MPITPENNYQVLPFEITITGKGGHGAMPNKAIDPVVATAAIIQEMSRAAEAYAAALNFLLIDAGTKFNIIPEEVRCIGSLVAATRQSLETCLEDLCLIAETSAAAFRCKFSLSLQQTVQEGNANGR